MSDTSDETTVEPLVEQAELVDQGGTGGASEPVTSVGEQIEQPAKVMRVGAMMRQLLEQVREIDLDEPSRERMRDIYEQSITELSSALSPELHDELLRLSGPFSDVGTPSEAELAVAKAQLVGWLEGLVQGIQATLFAQQVAAQQQLASIRGGLPAGAPPQQPGQASPELPGQYL
jgi:hypothetical protein